MRILIASLIAVSVATSAIAGEDDNTEAQVRAAVMAFNGAYENNEVDEYFSHYAADTSVYFYGARQDIAAYHQEWKAMVEAGGGVEKNEISDIRIQVMPGDDVAIASYFVDYRLRDPNGDISTAKAFESDVWRKIDGKWQIVNLHYSEIAEQN